MEKMIIERGMIFLVDFGESKGSCQSGLRPAIVISNRMANKYSPVVMVCPITTKFSKKELPTHVKLNIETCGMKYQSQVLTEQIYPINKTELMQYIGMADSIDIKKINEALEISVEVGSATNMYSDNAREMQIAKQKAKSIQEIDSFIKVWLEGGRSLEAIPNDMEERIVKIKELENFCKRYGLNYRDYYRPLTMNNGVKNNIRMVG